MPWFNLCSLELFVHVASRSFIAELVAGATGHLFDATLDGRKQHDVVQVVKSGACGECWQEPWADDAVIDGVVAPEHEATNRRCSRLCDHCVLRVGIQSPRIDPTGPHKPEELIALKKHAVCEV